VTQDILEKPLYALVQRHIEGLRSVTEGRPWTHLMWIDSAAMCRVYLSVQNYGEAGVGKTAVVEGLALRMMQLCVDVQTAVDVVSGLTGIPVGTMVKHESCTVLPLRELLEKRIIRQSHALEAIWPTYPHRPCAHGGPASAYGCVSACRPQRCGEDRDRAGGCAL
jgi:hypothetical protein